MIVIPNTDNRLYLTNDKKVYNSKSKNFMNVDSGYLRTRVCNKNIVLAIDKLHRLMYPENYPFSEKKWVDIKNYEGLYQINDEGEILSLQTNKILKNKLDKDGYCLVNLYKNKIPQTFKIHRLVAQYFLTSEIKETVNHLDGNKKNNRVENLQWATRSENNKHAYDIGLKVQRADYVKKKVVIMKNKVTITFESIKKCCEFLECSRGQFERAMKRKSKQKYYKGVEILNLI